jgi:hypothetical protein
MIRTIASIVITLLLLFALSWYEMRYVDRTFEHFNALLLSLRQKTEEGKALYEDGTAVQKYWDKERRRLHVWLPHSSLLEVDYQMNEALGFLYLKDYEDAMPKIDVLVGLSETIPEAYSLSLGNIF